MFPTKGISLCTGVDFSEVDADLSCVISPENTLTSHPFES